MPILNELKLSNAAPTRFIEPKHRARSKLLAFLMEQRAAAQADIEKRSYTPTRMTSHVDENGNRIRVEAPKRVRRAWFSNRQPDGSDVTYFQLRYGNKPLSIAKGKSSIEVGRLQVLPALIEKIMEAVTAGELDEVLAAATAERKAAFRARKKV